MAWACTGKSHEELVNNLVENRLIHHPLAIKAMRAVDRALFVNPSYKSYAYEDRPLPIGYDVTISAPHMHAMMLDEMAPYLGPGTTGIDIGSGSGYITACMAHMCDVAYGIEHVEPLIPRSIDSLKKCVPENKFIITKGDGRYGWAEHAPYNVIHVGAAAEPSVVDILLPQLKPEGILIIPVELGLGNQILYAYTFDSNHKPVKRNVCGVMFVPLKANPSTNE